VLSDTTQSGDEGREDEMMGVSREVRKRTTRTNSSHDDAVQTLVSMIVRNQPPHREDIKGVWDLFVSGVDT
jgi:hypothetical protein